MTKGLYRENVMETTQVEGLVDATLEGAVTGAFAFSDAFDASSAEKWVAYKMRSAITDANGNPVDNVVEAGICPVLGNTLKRSEAIFIRSSNSNALVDWPAGVKNVWCELLGDEMNRVGQIVPCGLAGGDDDSITLSPEVPVPSIEPYMILLWVAAETNPGPTVLGPAGHDLEPLRLNGEVLLGGEVIAGREYGCWWDPDLEVWQLLQFGGGVPSAMVTAGENIAALDLIYQDIYNQRAGGATKWYKVDADATAPVRISPRLGIAMVAINSGEVGRAQVQPGRVAGFTSLTAGQPVYASTTAGGVTQTAPALPSSGTQTAMRRIGFAASSTEIDFDPEPDTVFIKRQSSLAVDSTITVEHWPDAGGRDREVQGYLITADTYNLIDRTAGTNIGNMTGGGGLTAIFDGTTSQTSSAGGRSTDGLGSGQAGKNYGSGQGRKVRRLIAYSSSDLGFNYSVGGTDPISLRLEYSDNGSSWTEAGIDTFANANTLLTKTINVSDVGSHEYWRARLGAGGGVNLVFSEVQFYTLDAARDEPLRIGSWTIDTSALDCLPCRFDDGSGSDAETKSTFKNRTNATRDIAVEVIL